MADWKDNVSFVLVEPKEPGNIGAAARAMKNMGFRHLELVRPHGVLTGEARWLAHNAEDVLDSARSYPGFADAIKDKSLVIGTSRRTGKRRGLIVPIEEGAGRIFDIARHNRVALLFGREARGLLNEEVEECGFLMTIPSSRLQPSLNLAQSVLIAAYELSKAGHRRQDEGGKHERRAARLVTHEELRALYDRMTEVLTLLEYIPRGDRDLRKKIMHNLKHFVGRAGLTEWELNMLHGICSQVEKKIPGT